MNTHDANLRRLCEYLADPVISDRVRTIEAETQEAYWGERCPDRVEGCITCAAYDLYDALGFAPSFDEAYQQLPEEHRHA